jgi:N utilization substance protein B
MKPRTKARGVALQALYEIDITNHNIGAVLEARFDDANLEKRLEEFARSIVNGVSPIRKLLDNYIAEHAPEWPIEQVSTIDRNLIRIALWEFAVNGETPIKVAINEAIELAKKFGSDSTPRFVNGVLGSLAARENEIKQSMKAKMASEKTPEDRGQ